MKNKDYVYTHPNTVWELIKHQLLIDISENIYKAGERFPSTNDLAKKYNVSGNTAGKVLDFLRDEEIIMNRVGIGFFVLPYAKAKCVNLLRKDFEERILNDIKLAKIIGYDKEKMLTSVSEIWDK